MMTYRVARLAAVMLLGACASMRPRSSTDVVTLVVHNHSFFDVNVFALPSPASESRVRLGNVIGFTTVQLRVPVSALRQRQSLVLYLHAIGSNRSWISPEVSVSPDVQPCLDIHADLAGGLTMSNLYTRVAPDSAGDHCGYGGPEAFQSTPPLSIAHLFPPGPEIREGIEQGARSVRRG